MAQRFSKELATEMPEVDAFIGLDQVSEAGDIVSRSVAATVDDPRLPAIDTLVGVHVEISVLGELIPFAADSYLDVVRRLPRAGAVVEARGRRGTFLPAVWEQLPVAEDFVAGLWRKAGLPARTWPVAVWTYDGEEFGTDVG